jgi:hypothetical protein
MNYFALSPERPNWSIPPQEFARKMISRWPTTIINEQGPESSTYFDFELDMPHSLVVGGFGRSGSTFIMDGDLRDMAQLALWFRSIVPAEHPLVFCDEACGYADGYSIALTPKTTEEEILNAFEFSPGA